MNLSAKESDCARRYGPYRGHRAAASWRLASERILCVGDCPICTAPLRAIATNSPEGYSPRELVFKPSLESRRRRALQGRIAAWPAWKVGRYVLGWKFAFLLTALQRTP